MGVERHHLARRRLRPQPVSHGTGQLRLRLRLPTGGERAEWHDPVPVQTADLVIESEAYQWLVVAGTKAQYKGTARLNGEGGYGFLLTATDDGKSDRFRLKVWEIASGNVVYDNSRGASDDVDAANPQVIESGNIAIHKG